MSNLSLGCDLKVENHSMNGFFPTFLQAFDDIILPHCQLAGGGQIVGSRHDNAVGGLFGICAQRKVKSRIFVLCLTFLDQIGANIIAAICNMIEVLVSGQILCQSPISTSNVGQSDVVELCEFGHGL